MAQEKKIAITMAGIIICLFLFRSVCYSQEVVLKLTSGKEIHGILLSISTEEVTLDPEGPVTYLSLGAKDIESLTFPDGLKLVFPITTDQIPEKIRKQKPKKDGDVEAYYYRNFIESYYFGGFSSRVTVLHGQPIAIIPPVYYDLIYRNTGLGGLGLAFTSIGRERRPDYMLDLEMSVYGAQMLAKFPNKTDKLMSGTSFDLDCHFTLYPLKERNLYPSPFVFAGIGGKLITMSPTDGEASSTSELHGAIPFGIGLRQKISRGVAFQVRERFLYSKLKGAPGFILPETRFELFIVIGKN